MRVSAALSLLALAGEATAVFKFPLKNGFPNPGPKAIAQAQLEAGGTLPNTPLPKQASDTVKLDFMVVAINEIFEVAYFTDLLNNVTRGVKGYEVPAAEKRYLMKSLKQIRAQEELHALGANAILKSVGSTPVGPCQYNFPVSNLKEAITFAQTFTDLVLGALPGIQHDLATMGGADVVPLVGSILAQEGEQTGYYRYFQNKVPSAAPFLTGNSGIFAANALLQLVIVPGSCTPPKEIPVLAPLTVSTKNIQPKNQTLTFQVKKTKPTASQFVTYISGQNAPVSVPVQNIKPAGAGAYTFTASFPFEGGFSKGLTIAALTKGKGPYPGATAPTEVAMDSVAGPGIIEIQ